MDLVSFLRSPVFGGVVAVGSAVLGIWIKSEMRHPKKQDFKKEDWAVGLALIQTACISFLTLMIQKGLQLHELVAKGSPAGPGAVQLSNFVIDYPLRLFGMLLFLWGMTSMVRRIGWKDEEEMNLVIGIVIPIAAGVFLLYAVIGSAQ